MDTITQAERFADSFHQGQKYGSASYITHLWQVVCSVQQSLANLFGVRLKSLQDIAWLHDILEDTSCTEEILRENFDKDVVDAVVAITKVEGESYEEYIARVRANRLSRIVKMHDTMCNLTESVRKGQKGRILKYTEQLRLLVE